MKTHVIEDVTLHLAHADQLDMEWVGRRDLMRQLLAAWLVVDPSDLPLNPRLVGKPGVGKTTLCHVMRAGLERSDACVAHIVTTQIGPDDLLRMLTAQFGLKKSWPLDRPEGHSPSRSRACSTAPMTAASDLKPG